jgi:hypothetical protein
MKERGCESTTTLSYSGLLTCGSIRPEIGKNQIARYPTWETQISGYSSRILRPTPGSSIYCLLGRISLSSPPPEQSKPSSTQQKPRKKRVKLLANLQLSRLSSQLRALSFSQRVLLVVGGAWGWDESGGSQSPSKWKPK